MKTENQTEKTKLELSLAEKEERKRRFDTVFGIYIAAVIGFILNILADLLRGWMFAGEVFSLLQKELIALLVLLLIISIIFLEFFIFDFRHELTFDQKFWSRFFDYFSNKHWLSRRVTKISKIILNIFKWSIWALFSGLFFVTSLPVFVIWVLISIIFNLGKKKVLKKRVKKSSKKTFTFAGFSIKNDN